MKILHVTGHSLVRLTPARTAAFWGRYTRNEGRAVAIDRAGGPGAHAESVNPYGLLCADKARHRHEVWQLMEWADVVHCHDDAHPCQWLGRVRGKRLVYHAHIGDIPERYFSRRRPVFSYLPEVQHVCITNGYGRHFDQEDVKIGKKTWGRLPDVIDIFHPAYLPCHAMRPKRLRVMFSYSNTRALGTKINAKCPDETKALLAGLRGVEVRTCHGVSFDQCMAERKAAHVVVDDVFSPYTHLGALEGASVGACVLTNYDDATVSELCDFVGAPRESYPFVRATPQTVRRQIEHYRSHVAEAIEVGRAARDWMERYYDPGRLLERYLALYGVV